MEASLVNGSFWLCKLQAGKLHYACSGVYAVQFSGEGAARGSTHFPCPVGLVQPRQPIGIGCPWAQRQLVLNKEFQCTLNTYLDFGMCIFFGSLLLESF